MFLTCLLLRPVQEASGLTAGNTRGVQHAEPSIAPPGDRFLDAWSERSFLDAVIFWERSMNHFLKTRGAASVWSMQGVLIVLLAAAHRLAVRHARELIRNSPPRARK